ncbi:efflux RND transporter periplasmic adaptor subunit [Colwellia sp. 6M3]|uniref:efflux RND transporter periplasmic adaptor subunit n=1 Tax=Colwellia sp. 6M3 TaxID=2759849 RepID=UPI0015F62B58|nr:efflux RND transporter periplasmic adaptor subunit [Colwellia sp. 6M3]MBA6417597.1 efflux RND transporter periplasmic adaptor subunit [Colwellia sp. 6M3]|tara:strand:- start:13472 stop:14608 length:1137 start_codon:yes stop_codon:yes gene_type:complete
MKKVLRLSLIALFVIFFAVFSAYDNTDLVDTYTFSSPVLKDTYETILASGNLEFDNKVEIRPEISGVVENIRIKEGRKVNKGDVLITLEQVSFKVDVNAAEAEVRIKKIELLKLEQVVKDNVRRLQQRQKLKQSGVASQDSIDELENELTLANLDVQQKKEELNKSLAQLARSQELLEKTVFRSPIDGIVLELNTKSGESVIAGTTNIVGSSLLVIAEPATLIANLKVDEADIGNVKVDQEVKIYTAANPHRPIAGTVSTMGLIANQRENAAGLFYKVIIDMQDNSNLYAGMSCRAELVIATESNVYALPISAILYNDQKPYVWAVKDGKPIRKFVSLGMSTDIEQSILSGLQLNDKVITGPARALQKLDQSGLQDVI